jgi:CBS-domain-containing membrane protein
MDILDKKFVRNKMRYVSQCVLAVMSIAMILIFLDARTHAVTVAALGSSSFIVFTMPHTKASSPRFLLGGYIIACFTGSVCCLLRSQPFIINLFASPEMVYPIFAAISVGAAIFLMVITNAEHPPAGGLALGLVLNPYSIFSVIVVLLGISSMVLLKRMLKPMMINLL